MHSRMLITRMWVVFAILGLVLAACGTATQTAGESPEAEETEAAEESAAPEGTGGAEPEPEGASGTVTIVTSSEPNSLAPDIDAITTSRRLYAHIHEAATKYVWDGEGLTLEPWLAEEWEQTDPTTWTFTLRDGIQFHNGEPLTAEAFEFALATYRENAGMMSTLHGGIEIEAVDDLTFEVTTDVENFAPVPAMLAFLYPYPPEYYEEVGAEEFGNAPMGTGPYMVAEWEKGVEIRLEANPDYWGPDQPSVQELIFRAVPEASSRVALLETGEADFVTEIPPALASRVDSVEGASLQEVPTNRRVFLFFNTFEPPTDDPLVRQAINHAIDREELVEALFEGHAGEFGGVYLPGELGHNPDVGYEHDPERARELLAEAGYPDGVTVDFHYVIGNYALDQETAEAIQGQLAEAGITANMDGKPISEISQDYANQDSTGMNFWTYAPLWLDPSFVGLVHFSSNGLYRYNWTEEQDQALEEALTETDPEERERLYQELEENLIMERAVWAPLYTLPALYGVSDRLTWEGYPRPDEMIDFERLTLNE